NHLSVRRRFYASADAVQFAQLHRDRTFGAFGLALLSPFAILDGPNQHLVVEAVIVRDGRFVERQGQACRGGELDAGRLDLKLGSAAHRAVRKRLGARGLRDFDLGGRVERALRNRQVYASEARPGSADELAALGTDGRAQTLFTRRLRALPARRAGRGEQQGSRAS